ncbi:hypothetical protein [Wolbachia endosymbiont (group A) of Trypoxylon clavicerum]|uniref:hypothetical protein n=1 Tax=Wolbachia endosymbiont (group A) of Trypoxylon clavicerum TaxID=2954064 RepID=UPI00222E3932|nr:hypothetical protein [Wolbachia endosymbiont (group A) of Trypoxylon clavicerum]
MASLKFCPQSLAHSVCSINKLKLNQKFHHTALLHVYHQLFPRILPHHPFLAAHFLISLLFGLSFDEFSPDIQQFSLDIYQSFFDMRCL